MTIVGKLDAFEFTYPRNKGCRLHAVKRITFLPPKSDELESVGMLKSCPLVLIISIGIPVRFLSVEIGVFDIKLFCRFHFVAR